VRNQYTRLLRRCKKLYFEEKIDFCKGDSKLMWQTLKMLVSSSASTDSGKFENIKFSEIYNNLSLVNKFNKFFIESVEEIAQSITEVDTYNAFSELKKLNITSKICVFVKLNINDLQKIIRDMKNVSFCDPINVHMLKQIFPTVGSKLLSIINRSLQEGIFPEKWKKSFITPIPKVDRPTQIVLVVLTICYATPHVVNTMHLSFNLISLIIFTKNYLFLDQILAYPPLKLKVEYKKEFSPTKPEIKKSVKFKQQSNLFL
jgi:hypothetical protein